MTVRWLLLAVVLVLLLPGVLGANSEVRADYIVADSIETTGTEYSIDGSTITNGTAMGALGWTDTLNPFASTEIAYTGTLSYFFDGYSADKAEYFLDPIWGGGQENASFYGVWEMMFYDLGGTSGSYAAYIGTEGVEGNILAALALGISATHWSEEFGDPTWQTCSENSIARLANKWIPIRYELGPNYTNLYINNTFCANTTGRTGWADRIWFYKDAGAPGFFVDDIVVYSGRDRPQTADPYSLPDAVEDADWLYPATDPDTDNQVEVWLNWTASTSSESLTLNYTLYVNGSWEWSGLNVTEYNWSLPGEAHYLLRVDVQDNGTWVTGDDRVYKYDVSSPVIVWGGDVAANNGTVTNGVAVWINNTLSDNNSVWAYNVSLSYEANGTILSYFNLSGISKASTTFNRSFSLSGLSSGDYIVTTEVSDSHTARVIKDFRPVQMGLKLEYEAYGGLISVELEDVWSWDYRQGYSTRRSDKHAVRSFTTWKERDRYVFSVDTVLSHNPFRTYEYAFLVSAEERVWVVDGSDYFAHLVVGDNWVDFEHAGAEQFVVERIDDFAVRVWVYSSAEKAAFRSIGGLNSLVESLEFEIDLAAPAIGSEVDDNGSAYSYVQSWDFDVSITDANTVSSAVFEFNGTNYTGSPIGGDVYRYTVTAEVPASSVYDYKWFANDSLDNWAVGSTVEFQLVQGSPGLSLAINGSGLWTVNNGTSVLVTASGASGVSILLSRNGSMVSNPDAFNAPVVGIHNYTAYPSDTVN